MTKPKTSTKATKATHEEHAKATPAADGALARGKVISTRGRRFVGKVVSTRMAKTVTVEWERRRYVPKYQRYERARTRVKAHDELGVKLGDIVEIVETRPISKTKHFLVMHKVSQ